MSVPYATPLQVRSLVERGLASRPGTASSLSDDKVLEAINSAEQTIDSRLGLAFSVPFDPVPPLVTDIALAIAAYQLDLTFREVKDYNSDLNPVLLRYRDAIALLQDIAKGIAALPGYEAPPDSNPPPNPNDGGSVVGVINPTLVQGCGPYAGQPYAYDPLGWYT